MRVRISSGEPLDKGVPHRYGAQQKVIDLMIPARSPLAQVHRLESARRPHAAPEHEGPDIAGLRRTLTAMSLPARLEPQRAGYAPVSILRVPTPAHRASPRDAFVAIPLQMRASDIAALQNLPPEGIWGRGAHWVSDSMGTPYAFFAATASVVVWLAVGAPMHWDNTWLMIMSTGASIMAFLMVFVVQTSQNRNEREMQFRAQQIEARTLQLQQDVADARADMARLLDVAMQLQQELARLAHQAT